MQIYKLPTLEKTPTQQRDAYGLCLLVWQENIPAMASS